MKICGFVIYGPAHLRNLWICYSGMSPRICGFVTYKKKFACPPLLTTNCVEVADAAGSGGHPAPGLLPVLLLPPHPRPSLLHQGLQVHPTIHSSIGAGNSTHRIRDWKQVHCKNQYWKLEINIPRKGIARPQSQFHIHVSVSDLYILTIDLRILLQEIRGPTLGIYKSLTDTWI